MIKPKNEEYELGKSILAGHSVITLREVELAFSLAKKDSEIAAIYTYLRAEFANHDQQMNYLKSTWSEIAPFYESTDDKSLKFLVKSQLRKNAYNDFAQKYIDNDLTGVQLINASKTQGAIFLPDASEPGRFRVSYFDDRGFFSHVTADSYNELIKEVWQMGCKEEANIIHDWSLRSEWTQGSELTLMIQQVNCDKMSFDEFFLQRTKLALKQKIAELLVLNHGEDDALVYNSLKQLLAEHSLQSNTLTEELIAEKPKGLLEIIAGGLYRPELSPKSDSSSLPQKEPVVDPGGIFKGRT